jgi:predicted aminopeptidase
MRFLFLLLLLLVAGCDTLSYYSQAIGGQVEILHAARPIDDWLADPNTPTPLRSRLELARRIRRFASAELALPENRSYTSYAELGRPYVVWNVFAAPEFSVEPKKECFPFTGCVSYRGFFSEEDARKHARALTAQGYDVHVGGVVAYSTLGWFDDPLLSTFIREPDAQLARLIFHELAHQVVYARDDTAFNESFAVAVEEEGVKRWLDAEGRGAELEAFHAAQARRQKFAAEVKETRTPFTTMPPCPGRPSCRRNGRSTASCARAIRSFRRSRPTHSWCRSRSTPSSSRNSRRCCVKAAALRRSMRRSRSSRAPEST